MSGRAPNGAAPSGNVMTLLQSWVADRCENKRRKTHRFATQAVTMIMVCARCNLGDGDEKHEDYALSQHAARYVGGDVDADAYDDDACVDDVDVVVVVVVVNGNDDDVDDDDDAHDADDDDDD